MSLEPSRNCSVELVQMNCLFILGGCFWVGFPDLNIGKRMARWGRTRRGDGWIQTTLARFYPLNNVRLGLSPDYGWRTPPRPTPLSRFWEESLICFASRNSPSMPRRLYSYTSYPLAFNSVSMPPPPEHRHLGLKMEPQVRLRLATECSWTVQMATCFNHLFLIEVCIDWVEWHARGLAQLSQGISSETHTHIYIYIYMLWSYYLGQVLPFQVLLSGPSRCYYLGQVVFSL